VSDVRLDGTQEVELVYRIDRVVSFMPAQTAELSQEDPPLKKGESHADS
jgi:hypothetical protein